MIRFVPLRWSAWAALLLLVWPPTGLRADVYELIPLTGAVWRFNQSSNLDGVNWTAPEYDDSAWQSGPSLLAYEANAEITPLVATPLNSPQTPVDGVAGHAYYFRIYFDWPRPTNNVTLHFTCRVDDCAVFYLNGVLLTNAGVNTPISFSSLGRGAIGTGTEAVVDEVFSIEPASLRTGTNVLAVEVHQVATTSSDVVWGARVEGEVDTTPPFVAGAVPLPGTTVSSFTSLEVAFNEPVVQVDASDLLVNNQPATNLVVLEASRYLFRFAPPATGQVQVAFAPGHGILDRAGLAFAGTNWTYTYDPAQQRQFEVAGTLYVDLRATNASARTATWTNQGALGHFTRVGTPTYVEDVLGTGIPGVLFNGTSDYYLGPGVPADIIGANDFSVEVWTLNPDIASEETIVSWGRRGATRINNGLNFGSHLTWGCATYFNDDLGWSTPDNIPSAGQWHHLVLTYNGGTLTRMYVDGALRAQKNLGGPLATEAAYGINLGCQRNNDGTTFSFFYSGYVNSVRIHSGLLSDSQIAYNYAAGPAATPATGPVVLLGQPASVVVSEDASVTFAVTAGGTSPIGYRWFRDGTPVPGVTGPTLTLTNVGFYDNGAAFYVVASNFHAGSPYTAVSAPATLTVRSAAEALRHRYAFDTDARDSVGTAHGQLINSPAVSDGAVTLNGVNQYVNLPNNLLTGYTAITLEAWVTDLGSGGGARLFDFGNSTGGEDFPLGGGASAVQSLYLALPGSQGNLRGACTVSGPTGEQVVEWDQQRPPVGELAHVVWTSDGPSRTGRLYVNGRPVGTNLALDLTPASLGNTLNNWLGRSQSNDPLFRGRIAEFRIYNVALADDVILRNYAAGPDQPPAPGPVRFVIHPSNQTVDENQPVSLTAHLNGTPPFALRWYRNGLPLADATNRTLAFIATVADHGAAYQLWATNTFLSTVYTAGSSNAVLAVTPDTTPPALIRVVSLSTNQAEAVFSEPLSQESATDLANYTLTGPGGTVPLLSAALDSTGTRVRLTTAPLMPGTLYTLTVNGVRDRAAAANPIAPDSQAVFLATPYSLADVNGASPAGTLLSGADGLFLTAGGADIGGNADQFTFAREIRSGDFDIQVRLQALGPLNVWTKAGLMARETLEAGSRFAAVLATPMIVGAFFEYRSTNAGPAQTSGSFPPNFPDLWLRLRRAGHQFSGYASFDGQMWTLLGTVNLALSNTLQFGLCLASHENGLAATAQFRDVGPTASTNAGAVASPYEPPGPCTRRTGLVISEIMYRPAPRLDGRVLEFIEIYNSNPFFHDIGGHRLSGDVDFTFPPGTIIPAGGLIVVAASPADVAAVYGLSGVYGPYTNRLPTAGTVRLRDEQGAVLLEVPYANTHPWPAAADGTGHSIILARPSYGEADPRAWDISDVVGGSPGALEAFRPSPLRDVVLNEVLANAGPGEDFIELYNHSNRSTDISGCVLTDNPDLNKFIVPAGTVIPPRGFVVFAQSQLGFGLKGGGDTAYFKNPDGSRVLDAVRFEAQAEGVSRGRWPDGAGELYPLSTPTPGAANAAPGRSEVVINEILYHPISKNDDDQFIELFNWSSNAVTLAGWKFVDGVDFVFPSNAVIAAGGYVVVARNRTNLLARYPALNPTNTFGDFNGRLSHAGERLALSRPRFNYTTNGQGVVTTNLLDVVVDEVTYADGGRWGEWSDGGGSSLELIDPRANPRRPSSWADSDESSKAAWTTIQTTGVLDNGSNYGSDPIGFVQIGQVDPGECLIDDVEVLPQAGTPNYVANPNFTSGLANWALQGCFSRSSLEAGGGYGGTGNALRLRTANRLFSVANSAQGTLNNTSLASGQTATLRFKARWLRGCPDIVMRLAGNWLEAAGTMSVPANLGTPGARNSRAVSNAPPAIHAVSHAPALPAPGQPVVVTARVEDPDGVGTFTLQYRVDPSGSYTSLALRDDGAGGDAVAGDGVFSATLPGQASGALVAFILNATDARGATARYPELLNNNGPDRECAVRWGEPDPTSSFGTYHFWLTQTNVNRWRTLPVLSNEDIDGTLVYNNRVIYNIKARYAGSPYHQAFDGPAGTRACHYNFEVPADDKLLGHVSFNKLHWIGNDIQDDSASQNINDSTLQREQTAYTFLRGLGQPWVYRRYVAVYFNGVRRGQLMEDALRPSVSVPEMYFPNDTDCSLYKVQPWFEGGVAANADTSWPWQNKSWAYFIPYTTAGGAYKVARYRWCYQPRQAPGSLNNFSNFLALVTIGANYTDPNWSAQMESVADMENWLRLMAANHAAGNWDCWGIQNGQNVYAYQSRQTRWTLFMFDFSIVLGNRIAWAPGSNLETIPGPDLTWQNIYSPGSGKPVFRRMYWRALKELVNGAMTPAQAHPLLDAKYRAFVDTGITAASPQVIKDWIAAARSSIASQVATRDTPQFALATNWVLAVSNTAVLSGTAPLEISTLVVDGAVWPVTWSSTVAWSLRLPAVAGTNSFVLLGLDSRGRLVSGASNLVTVANPVPAEPAAGNVVFNEIMARPWVLDAEYVELFNNSSNVAFNLSGWRINGLGYTFPSGSFILPRGFLVLVKDRAAYTSAYGSAAPIFDVFPGNLQRGAETLSLIQPGATPEADVVVDRVRYEAGAPWPAGATNGIALQLVDSRQDNSRVSNWSDGSGWRFFSFTGSTSNATANRLSLFFDSGGGDFYLDDIALVPLSGPNAGTNLLRDAGFEQPLGAGSPWVTSAVTVASAVVSNVAHSGRSCLRFVMNAAPALPSHFYQNLLVTLPQQTPCTVSFWYLPAGRGTNLTAYLNTHYRAVARVTPPPPATPGTTNAVVAALPPYPPLWLNEVLPLNVAGLTDAQGEREPWIELYNAGTNAVALDGFYLSDTYTNLTQWAFPTGAVIEAGQFRIVFADGEPNEGTPGEWHAGFRLNSGPGAVVLSRLVNNAPQIVDYLNFGSPGADRSYGDFPDGQPFFRQEFDLATPAATNNAAAPPRVVFINEWMAGNAGFLRDPADNDTDDWFELYNPNPTAVDLGGYFLTDNLTNRTQFEVPRNGHYVIPPGGYLLVWADGEPNQNSTNQPDLHVNFQLRQSGEAIGLFAPDGTPIDLVIFGPQTNNVSMGRSPDGSTNLVFFPAPTPGAANFFRPPAPLIRSLTVEPEAPGSFRVTLTFSSTPGAAYRVEWKDALTDPQWTALGPAQTATGTVFTVSETVTGRPQRFYRVVVP